MSTRMSRAARLIATGMTTLNPQPAISPTALMHQALEIALQKLGLAIKDINGLIALPSLAETHFMQGHYCATKIGLLPRKGVVVRTLDTGGAGPVTALLEAKRMVESEGLGLVAVVAGDAVKSLDSFEFLRRADQTCQNPNSSVKSPVIPSGYDLVAQYQIQKYGITREQLAMCSALMSIMASKHPYALSKKPKTVDEILGSKHIAPVTSGLECARRADGGAAYLVASARFLKERNIPSNIGCVILGGGEASGSLYPPEKINDMTEDMFSCGEAAAIAFDEAQLSVKNIDFFGLYDCFPICLIRAIEAVGLAPNGKGGIFIENAYQKILSVDSVRPQDIFPINTHGGLLAFGAPWEVPAMYSIIEAFAQLKNQAGSRQVRDASRALVYGNGGIFSHSAVAILGNGTY